jgi:hypothetical protein
VASLGDGRGTRRSSVGHGERDHACVSDGQEGRPSCQQQPHFGRRAGFTNYGIAKPYDIYPENTGLLIQPGNTLSFHIHYSPMGEPVEGDVVEVGLWFCPEG